MADRFAHTHVPSVIAITGVRGCEREGHKRSSPPKAFGPIHFELRDRNRRVALAGNAEAVEDGSRGVGAVESVEMDAGDVVVQEVVTLFQGEMNANATDHGTVVFAALEGPQ